MGMSARLSSRTIHARHHRAAVAGVLVAILVATGVWIGAATAAGRGVEPRHVPVSRVAAVESAASPYVWPNGPSPDPFFFPIAVWLQTPDNAAAYKDIGINLYIGQWQGPTVAQLGALTAAGMPTIADQNDVALAHLDDPILAGWLQQDEPDNAQSDGAGGYGPCVEPAEVIARYTRMRAADPSRPVLLNLGQGVAHDYDRPYVGRGSACARRWDQYPEYVKGADIVAFDIYPVTSPYDHIRGQLWRVALGVDRLREWTGGEKIVWNVIETTHISSDAMPTPHQVRAEVWMSLVHGSMGIVYFAHEWQPRFREAGLLYYPEMRDAVGILNRQIHDLAPVLNAATVIDGVTVASSSPEVPVDAMVKEHDGWTYVFAVAMRDGPTEATFTLPRGAVGTEVEVIGEDRRIALTGSSFRDVFAGYAVHLYRLRTRSTLELPWLSN
jgi:hypothetical protein